MTLKIPIATLALIAFTLIAYSFISNGGLFVETGDFYAFAFGLFDAPLNVVNYLFVHTGPLHLALNLSGLLLYGFLSEQALQRKDILGVYLLSGVVAAVVFSLLEPDTLLVGSSTAVYGLFGAAILLKPRETIIGALLFLLASSYLIVPVVSDWEESVLKELNAKKLEASTEVQALEEDLNAASTEKEAAASELERLEERRKELADANQPTREVEEEIQETARELEVVREKEQELVQKASEKKIAVEDLEKKEEVHLTGKERELTAPIAITSHSAATLVGSLYVLRFRRGKVARLKWLDEYAEKIKNMLKR